MSSPSRISYPRPMDDKVYTTIDGQPVTQAEFDAWVETFTSEIVAMPPEALGEFWKDAELVPYSDDTPTQVMTLELSEAELAAIDRKAAEAGHSREAFIRIAILLALA